MLSTVDSSSKSCARLSHANFPLAVEALPDNDIVEFRPSVCPVDRQQQRRVAGFLLSAGEPRDLLFLCRCLTPPRSNSDTNFAKNSKSDIPTATQRCSPFDCSRSTVERQDGSCETETCETIFRQLGTKQRKHL